MISLRTAYSGVGEIFARYWQHYGGWRAFFFSPYLHFSLLLTLGLYPYWRTEPWWTLAITILPSILGFSLAGYAIWLGFGDEKFRLIITRSNGEKDSSGYMVVTAAFAHFVILQVAALIGAVIATATAHYGESPTTIFDPPVALYEVAFYSFSATFGHGIGFLLFVYALMSALAAALAVFRVASWYDAFQRSPSRAATLNEERKTASAGENE